MKFSRRCLLQGLTAAIPAARGWADQPAALPEIEREIGSARVTASGRELMVQTGRVERRWRLTEFGLVTTGLRNSITGREWAAAPARSCDWSVAGFGIRSDRAALVKLEARPVRFDPYTSDHLEITAEFDYPGLRIRYTIWAYPGGSGIRTQLSAKGAPHEPVAGTAAEVEYLPIDCSRLTRRAAGYYNNTQHRNNAASQILREEAHSGMLSGAEFIDWANLFAVESGGEGVCLVKESHKCVNQAGVDTGSFGCSPSGIIVTGWGVGAADLTAEQFKNAWATWTILFDGGDDGRELAIKTFDRLRYPVDPRRDLYLMANTWGSSTSTREAQDAAREENVLLQIDACKDLGIDVLQIDDGWQGPGYTHWTPSPERYPNGWKKVRDAARRAGVKLGVWVSWAIPESDLEENFDNGGFQYFKVDFAALNTYRKVEFLVAKIKALIEHSGHTVRVNWDVTENSPRMGYYFGREFGNIYLENRKPAQPEQVVYIPYLVLRDAWQVSRYTNLDRFQVSIQNIDRVSRDGSDAFRHTHPYAVAIALMSTPLFFQEVSLNSAEARDQIRPLLRTYKQHRQAIFRGYTFPIGEKPSNASWTGFQNHDPATRSGYLLLFRELHSPEEEHTVQLKFVAGSRLRLTDLRSQSVRSIPVPSNGEVRFTASKAPDFVFCHYQCVDSD